MGSKCLKFFLLQLLQGGLIEEKNFFAFRSANNIVYGFFYAFNFLSTLIFKFR